MLRHPSGRSHALGLTVTSAALTQTIVPPLAKWLIAEFGWQQAWYMLGLGWGALAVAASFFFLHGAHERTRQQAQNADANSASGPARLGRKESLRDPVLLRIAAATMITMILGSR